MSNFKEDLMKVKAFAFDVDGVLSAQIVPLHPSGEVMRTANIKDGYALQLAVKLGYPVAIITGGNTMAVKKRYQGLGIEDIYMASSEKMIHFNEWINKRGLKTEEIMYMGDDLPDYPVMKTVGVPVCPSDAVEEIKSLCKYISHKNGGEGCARDLIEQVLRAHGKWGYDHTW
ncbi:3-deoxy-D-manno-octulosonate 8-phosphate phosphatase [Labilibacter sediminis]|nr:3-deoxy-D-manno-octulosonate 8-phosphate phosphatase [Labilibacter sediminis]